jgi:hypothetical protein
MQYLIALGVSIITTLVMFGIFVGTIALYSRYKRNQHLKKVLPAGMLWQTNSKMNQLNN